jgi:hypothetical protein
VRENERERVCVCVCEREREIEREKVRYISSLTQPELQIVLILKWLAPCHTSFIGVRVEIYFLNNFFILVSSYRKYIILLFRTACNIIYIQNMDDCQI